MYFSAFNIKRHKLAYDDDMGKVTVTIYMEEEDKEALQQLADAEERSLSQMAVLIVKRAIKKAQDDGTIRPKNS
ncbi:MAG: ribbon-helix-helix protein, CopG family [Nostoc sp.]